MLSFSVSHLSLKVCWVFFLKEGTASKVKAEGYKIITTII